MHPLYSSHDQVDKTLVTSDLCPDQSWPAHLVYGQPSHVGGGGNPSARRLITFLYMITKIPKLHTGMLTWNDLALVGLKTPPGSGLGGQFIALPLCGESWVTGGQATRISVGGGCAAIHSQGWVLWPMPSAKSSRTAPVQKRQITSNWSSRKCRRFHLSVVVLCPCHFPLSSYDYSWKLHYCEKTDLSWLFLLSICAVSGNNYTHNNMILIVRPI